MQNNGNRLRFFIFYLCCWAGGGYLLAAALLDIYGSPNNDWLLLSTAVSLLVGLLGYLWATRGRHEVFDQPGLSSQDPGGIRVALILFLALAVLFVGMALWIVGRLLLLRCAG
jgi:hypothetical protein